MAFCLALHVGLLPLQRPTPLSSAHYLRKLMSIVYCCFYNTDTYGLFNFLMPGASFYSAIEASSLLVSVSF